jgi:hypothetical protein
VLHERFFGDDDDFAFDDDRKDDGDFDESKHPRNPDGKFGEGGGESGSPGRAHQTPNS